MSDFLIIDRIQKETDLATLKSLFLQFLHDSETQKSQMHLLHEQERRDLESQAIDAKRALKVYKKTAEVQKGIYENEIEQLQAQNHELAQKLDQISKSGTFFKKDSPFSKKTSKEVEGSVLSCQTISIQTDPLDFVPPQVSEDSDVALKIEKLNLEIAALKNQVASKDSTNEKLRMENQSLKAENIRLSKSLSGFDRSLQLIYDNVQILSNENQSIRNNFFDFQLFISNYLQQITKVSSEICFSALDNQRRLKNIQAGLLVLKQSLNSFSRISFQIPTINFADLKNELKSVVCRSFIAQRLTLERKVIEKQEEMNFIEPFFESTLTITREIQIDLNSVRTSFHQFHKFYQQTLDRLRQVTSAFHYNSTKIVKQKSKKLKQAMKLKNQEIANLKIDLDLISKQNDLNKTKYHQLLMKPQAKLPAPVHSPPPKKVDVGILVHLKNPDAIQMREMALRFSKEAELTAINRQNLKLEEERERKDSQIAALKGIIKKTSFNQNENFSKSTSKINELEGTIRELKKQNQEQTSKIAELGDQLSTSKQNSIHLSKFKKVFSEVFRNFATRLTPLIENLKEDDLLELDEISQQMFGMPIHKICVPQDSTSFLQKLERDLSNALSSNNSREIASVFDTFSTEFVRRIKASQ